MATTTVQITSAAAPSGDFLSGLLTTVLNYVKNRVGSAKDEVAVAELSVPDAPSSVSGTDGTDGTATIAWTPSAGGGAAVVQRIDVYDSSPALFATAYVAPDNDGSGTVVTLTADTGYTATVTAVNSEGESISAASAAFNVTGP